MSYKPYVRPTFDDEDLTDDEMEAKLKKRKMLQDQSESKMSVFQADDFDRVPPDDDAAEVAGTPPDIFALAPNECPFCSIGRLEKRFTLWGILFGIFLFPCGMYCCFLTRIQVCNNCGQIIETESD